MNRIDRTILIAEDEEGVRKNIAEFLALHYMHVYEARNGLESYELYQDVVPDLIITDINMPGMDGLSLVENIRKTDNEVPIIIISAHSDREKLLRAVKLNLVDYIVKPIERKTLKALIAKAFSKSEVGKKEVEQVVLGEGFVFDPESMTLYRDEMPVELTRHQRLLIDILVQKKNQVVSAVDIFFHVQEDYTLEFSSAAVRNLVKKLRKVFPGDMIRNVYGSGYSLVIPEKPVQLFVNKYDDFPDAVAVLDEAGKIIGCNKMLLQMFGYTEKYEVLGGSMSSLLLPSEEQKLRKALKYSEHVTDEIYLQRRDGTVFLAKTRCKVSAVNGQHVRTVSMVDLSETLKRYAVDSLTSLRTRAVLELEFNNLMERHRSYGEQASALFIDIDNFKHINDTLGHRAGDDIIQKVAAVLSRGVRKEDVVVRWGGDEFMILLFDASLEDTKRLAEAIRCDVERLSLHCGTAFTCSFGIDTVRREETLETLLYRIDHALIKAKNSNKNCVVGFEEATN